MPESSFDKELIASNLLGANTLQDLHEKEKILTNAKMIMLSLYPVQGTLDYKHLKAIHHFLFVDVYTWAENAGYILSFQNISEDEMIRASIKGASGNLVLMNEIFSKALKQP